MIQQASLVNGCESKSGVRSASKVLGLSNWADGFTVNENGEGCGERGLRGCKESFGFYMFLSHLSRDFELAVETHILNLGEKCGLEIYIWEWSAYRRFFQAGASVMSPVE